LFLGIGSVPWALLQGAGRPDIPTKLNLIELPFYLTILWWLTGVYGINGTALAWSFRAVIDALALMFFAHRFLANKTYDILKCAVVVGLMLASFWFAMLTSPTDTKMEFLSVVLLIHFCFFWVFLLNQNERTFLQAKIRLK
jgi:O-antigen/teichoic acid export membrane protein